MGCRQSSSPPETPIKRIQPGGPVILKSKISVHRAQVINHRTSNGIKSASRLSIASKKTCLSLTPPSSIPLSALCLEMTLNGSDKNLVKRFELNTPCLLLGVSRTHTLLLDGRQLRLIDMETTHIQTTGLPLDCGDIQDISWSAKLNRFLLLTTDQLYQMSTEYLHPTAVHQIQFISEGPRRSFMAIDGDDLLINRSFGYDIRRYSLSKLCLIQSPRAYLESENLCVTMIRLNSSKILALAVSIAKQQMIDLVNLKTEQLIRRVNFNVGENISYPIDLCFHEQWFAKTNRPDVNIGHCLISPDGQITRLQLYPRQDNFIRSLCVSPDSRWLLVSRQNILELHQLYLLI